MEGRTGHVFCPPNGSTCDSHFAERGPGRLKKEGLKLIDPNGASSILEQRYFGEKDAKQVP